MIQYINDESVIITFLAPYKQSIHIVGEFNNWQISDQYQMQKQADNEIFSITISNLDAQREYAYQFLIDRQIAIADPYSEKILDPKFDAQISSNTYPNLKKYPYENPFKGTVSVLQTAQKKYEWQAKNFVAPPKEDLVIYELLIRDFLASRKYRDVVNYIPYLKNLGINAIELLPVNEFTGNESWGYNPTFYFAADKAYGTKDDLKYLIDKCHENGIAVILDVVFNHADKKFSYYKAYTDYSNKHYEHPFFNQKATHPYSVFFDFNHESKYTQAFFDDVCRFWLEEYNIDGFRFDLTKGFTQVKTDPDVAKWSSYDASRVRLLKRMYDKIRSYNTDCYLILEHLAANDEETVLANYGFMLWGGQNHQFRHLMKGTTDDVSWLNYENRGWKSAHLVGYIESHDEERVIFDAAKELKSTELALQRAKAAAVVFFAYQGPKLLWQFSEFGYDINIDFNGRTGVKPLKWDYLEDKNRQALLEVYRQMIHLKTQNTAFKNGDFIESSDGLIKRISINHASVNIRIIANFGLKSISTESNLEAGKWHDFFAEKELTISKNKAKITLEAGAFYVFTSTKLNKY